MERGNHFPITLALDPVPERTCRTGDDPPVDFRASLRWRQFTDLWVAERRRQLCDGMMEARR